MNKKGFTLVEVVITILIIMVLLLIVVPNVRSILSRNTLKLWKENENRLIEASNKYLLIKNIQIPIDTAVTITKEQLMEEKLIKEIYDLNDKNKTCAAHVDIANVSGEYQETAYIECENGYHTE